MDPLDRSSETDFERDVVAVLMSLGPGEIATYGEVAAEAGYPGAARAVGSVLGRSRPGTLAWWRVVNAAGRLVPGREQEQTKRLVAEGVTVRNGHVA